jgi:hypothetical protein
MEFVRVTNFKIGLSSQGVTEVKHVWEQGTEGRINT